MTMKQFVTLDSRNELHKLWDDCFYSPEQRNRFRLVLLYIYRVTLGVCFNWCQIT